MSKIKRRKVTVNTSRPAPGMMGGTPTTTKTITKKRGKKTITKTKSISSPMGPGKARVTKTKTVTKPGKQATPFSPINSATVKSKNKTKSVSKEKAFKMTSKLKSRKGATTSTKGRRKPLIGGKR